MCSIKNFCLFGIIFLLVIPMISAEVGLESMLEESSKISRGMTLFFTTLIFVATIPFLNKYFVSLMTLFFAIGLSRGFLRIGEQDYVKSWYSMNYGLLFGLKLVIAILLANMVFVLLTFLFKRLDKLTEKKIQRENFMVKVKKENLQDKQIINALDYGIKKGYTIEELVKVLRLKGATFFRIDNLIFEANVKTRVAWKFYKNRVIASWVMLVIAIITIILVANDLITAKYSYRTLAYSIVLIIILIFNYLFKYYTTKKERERIDAWRLEDEI